MATTDDKPRYRIVGLGRPGEVPLSYRIERWQRPWYSWRWRWVAFECSWDYYIEYESQADAEHALLKHQRRDHEAWLRRHNHWS